jgi:micrococcal nuclease
MYMQSVKRIFSYIVAAVFVFLLVYTLVSEPGSLPKVLEMSEGEVLSETISLLVDEASPTPLTPSAKDNEMVVVTRVVDGDTIEIEGGQRVRYIGVDTPESKHPQKPVECFAKEATQRNKELVEGQQVRLEKDVNNTDRYGRLLRYLYVDDIMINEQLVAEGFAQASAYPPDVKYQETFDRAQQIAQQEGRGLWGDVCIIE